MWIEKERGTYKDRPEKRLAGKRSSEKMKDKDNEKQRK